MHLTALLPVHIGGQCPPLGRLRGLERRYTYDAGMHTMWPFLPPYKGKNRTVEGKTNGSETDIRSEREELQYVPR